MEPLKTATFIAMMESAVLESLSYLEKGYGNRKWKISKDTGIPEDILTPILKRLKYDGKIELIMIWDEIEYKPNGSGYCLSGNTEF